MATSIQINPWETLIQYLKTRPNLAQPGVFGNQIAARHKYNNGWSPNSLGLALKPESGIPELYVDDDASRYECRLYGSSPIAISTAFLEIKAVFRDFERTVVDQAVIQRLYFETTPSFLDEPVLKMPFYLFFINAVISEIPVPL